MIEIRDLAFSYGRTLVLESVTATFGDGLHLVLGPNGCGKSTLLRLVSGIEMPSAGTVHVDGHDLWNDELAARARLTYVPEHPDLTPFATLRDVARLVARLRGRPDVEGDEALEALGMAELHRRSVRELSMGQRRRALLATARIATPHHVLLDEPLDALDRAARQSVLEWIDALVARGHSVLVISHDLEPFADRPATAGYLAEGRWHSFDEPRGFSFEALDRMARAESPSDDRPTD